MVYFQQNHACHEFLLLKNIFILVLDYTNILSHNHASFDARFWVVLLRLNIIFTSCFSLHIETRIIIDSVSTDIPTLQRVYQVLQFVFSRPLPLSNCMIWRYDMYHNTCISLHIPPNLFINKWLAFINIFWSFEWFLLICVCFYIRHELLQPFKKYVMIVDVLTGFRRS